MAATFELRHDYAPEAECLPGHLFMHTDSDYMRRALELAARGRGRTSPNPMVGCAIVRDGEIIGEGWHEQVGGPHAEINALKNAGDATGATMYVSLEPCCNTGRTGPCTEAVLASKPARVVVAMHDPDPKVSGEGIFFLRNAGIPVDVGVCEDEARLLNEAYVKHRSQGMPFVIAKCGMSLDGKIATRTGDSRWVTCEESRRMVHRLRDEVDAILVGSRTVMLDDPTLTTRLEDDRRGKDPVRVIVDADEYLDEDRRVFHVDSGAPTWVAVPEGRAFTHADRVFHIPALRGTLDLRVLMRELAEQGIMSVLIEGGGTTHASAFEAGIVDKVMFFVAPKIIGGRDAVTAVEGDGTEKLDDAVMLDRMTAEFVGQDLLVQGYVKHKV